MPGSFFDTNILIYAAVPGQAHAARARELLRSGGTISVQSLNELANIARRKLDWSWEEIVTATSQFRALLDINAVDVPTHDLGVELARKTKFHIYDALLLAAALRAGCTTFWSEDLQHGQVIEGMLTIRNPFL